MYEGENPRITHADRFVLKAKQGWIAEICLQPHIIIIEDPNLQKNFHTPHEFYSNPKNAAALLYMTFGNASSLNPACR